jgi:hypothetical protein
MQMLPFPSRGLGGALAGGFGAAGLRARPDIPRLANDPLLITCYDAGVRARMRAREQRYGLLVGHLSIVAPTQTDLRALKLACHRGSCHRDKLNYPYPPAAGGPQRSTAAPRHARGCDGAL